MRRAPINFTGNKYRLLSQILPLLKKKRVFMEPFMGSGVVGLNVDAEIILFGDVCSQLVTLYNWFKISQPSFVRMAIEVYCYQYSLSKTNNQGYYDLRTEYNSGLLQGASPLFYLLLAHSFNNQFRFNKLGAFNVPFGQRTITKQLYKRLDTALEYMHNPSSPEMQRDVM